MTTSRRDFIAASIAAVLGVLGLGFLAPAFTIFAPLRGREKQLAFFPLIAEDDLPRRGVKKAEFVYSAGGQERKTRVFIVTGAEGPVVLSATCSHLGCLVNYHKDKGEFVCPCHGGRYDSSGRNIAGPPPAPLSRFPVRIENGVVLAGVKV